MKKHDNRGGIITFRYFVGDGTYLEMPFKLSVSMMPDGQITGMPVIDFGDDHGTTVTFDMEDIIKPAYQFAFGCGGNRRERA